MYLKALTFSYDDGKEQDRRLVELFNQYGLRATFNLNSGLVGNGEVWYYKDILPTYRIGFEELTELYQGHEIAVHGLTHMRLSEADKASAEREILEDKKNLEERFDQAVCGMAYACGEYTDEAIAIAKTAGIRYGRGIESTHSFDLETDMMRYRPTCHHYDERIFQMGEQFLNLVPDKPQIFYVWGHSYEFDLENGWEHIEKFCRMMSGRDDILYGTNREIFEYFGMI